MVMEASDFYRFSMRVFFTGAQSSFFASISSNSINIGGFCAKASCVASKKFAEMFHYRARVQL